MMLLSWIKQAIENTCQDQFFWVAPVAMIATPSHRDQTKNGAPSRFALKAKPGQQQTSKKRQARSSPNRSLQAEFQLFQLETSLSLLLLLLYYYYCYYFCLLYFAILFWLLCWLLFWPNKKIKHDKTSSIILAVRPPWLQVLGACDTSGVNRPVGHSVHRCLA